MTCNGNGCVRQIEHAGSALEWLGYCGHAAASSFDRAIVVQLLKIFQEFYVTRRFITVFTRVLYMSLS
jgi:hypothetical protein